MHWRRCRRASRPWMPAMPPEGLVAAKVAGAARHLPAAALAAAPAVTAGPWMHLHDVPVSMGFLLLW